MNHSDLFSYLSAFVTIVLAVAITDMIQSTHRLIRARQRVNWDPLPLIFAAIVALFVVSEFFSLWGKFALEEVSISRLLWLLVVPTIFALLAYSVLPDEIPIEGFDLTKFYFSERRVWVLMFGAALLLDIVRVVEAHLGSGRSLTRYAAFIAPVAAGSLAALAAICFSRSRVWQFAALAVLGALTVYGTIDWTIGAKAGS